MSEKTLAMRFLEGQKVAYETATYATTTRDAEEVAGLVGADPAQVFKTLVVDRPPQKPLLVLIPANQQLDLKKLAKVVGAKKLKMATQQVAEQLTGLQVGGISPLALMNKGFKVMGDRSLQGHERVYLSSGQRGIQIKLAPADLIRVTKMQLADLV